MNAAAVESSRMHRRILERRQKAVEDQFSKGKAEQAEVEEIARELTAYEEQQPLRRRMMTAAPWQRPIRSRRRRTPKSR